MSATLLNDYGMVWYRQTDEHTTTAYTAITTPPTLSVHLYTR